MRASDFPKGKDGWRFVSDLDAVWSNADHSADGWIADAENYEKAAMIADALERVAELEEEQKQEGSKKNTGVQ